MKNTLDKESQTRACVKGIKRNVIYLKEEKVEKRANTYMITRDATYETISGAKCSLFLRLKNLKLRSGHTV